MVNSVYLYTIEFSIDIILRHHWFNLGMSIKCTIKLNITITITHKNK